MSYAIQPYTPNNGPVVDQQLQRAIFGDNIDGNADLFGSLFGLAHRLMAEVLQNGLDFGGASSLIGANLNNPHVKAFGISSMKVAHISRGPDGRPQIIEAHDERRMGPGGVWQTRKALRDPVRGIDKMQLGYFVGDRGQIVEHQLEPSTGQYRQETQRHGIAPNDPQFLHHWRMQSPQAMIRQPSLVSNQYQYYPQRQQQQLPLNAQQPQLALPAPAPYPYL